MKTTCEKCKFINARGKYYECRIHPPLLLAGWVQPVDLKRARPHDNVFRGLWPLVRPKDWCGQFEKAVGSL